MISIVIPTKNESAAIEATLKNIKDGLKNIPYEIIVSDGGSTDATQAIAARYAKEVVVYSGTMRQKISQGKNDGAKKASGEFLVFIDADVIVPSPDAFFRKALEDFARDPKLVALGSRIRVLPELERFSDHFFRGFHNFFNAFMNNILRFGTGSGEFQMVRADAFRKIGGFDEHIVASEDHDLFHRLAKIGHTRYDTSLTVFEEGRRARAVGWPRLMLVWLANGIAVALFKRSVSKEWKEVR